MFNNNKDVLERIDKQLNKLNKTLEKLVYNSSKKPVKPTPKLTPEIHDKHFYKIGGTEWVYI